jgi:cobalt-zinc-cadmium efflux system protein
MSEATGGHAHAHAGHRHGADANRTRLAIALVLASTYMVAEVVGGFLTGSLALLADAGHMLSDSAALALALFASWVASRPSGERWTYGRARAEILAALGQAVALLAVAVLIVVEAIERLQDPQPVAGLGMLGIATGGLVINLVCLRILEGGRADNMNIRGAWLHVLADALGSVGAMTAGVLVWRFGWNWADPAASLVISGLVLFSGWHLLRDAIDVLMEAAPRGLDVDALRSALADLEPVRSVHDLHVWTVGNGQVALSCHLVVPEERHATPLLTQAYELLGTRFGIDHATIQVEPETFAGSTPRSICHGCD